MRNRILMTTLILASCAAFGGQKVPACDSMSDEMAELSTNISGRGLETLPKMIYLAKSAKMYIVDKSQSLQLITSQSFVTAKSKVLCSSFNNSNGNGFYLYAPTLIDLTDQKNIGNSFWQFHVEANGNKIGVWNQKSRILNSSEEIGKILKKNSVQVSVHQISHEEFEITYLRNQSDTSIYVVIQYDSTMKIP